MRIIGGYQDTRKNNEDFAITPFLFRVWVKDAEYKIAGIGICWGWMSFHISLGFNLPKGYPTFTKL
jgi:hypothetical protein